MDADASSGPTLRPAAPDHPAEQPGPSAGEEDDREQYLASPSR